ncbi:hypothetical protein SDC9_204603 [bioreactor metagenome]|uniref:Uncharacterized protein n=1 Tax=bioreactor metagenome TaxID=1076179 RepID=A0A645J169_9ZZZZ
MNAVLSEQRMVAGHQGEQPTFTPAGFGLHRVDPDAAAHHRGRIAGEVEIGQRRDVIRVGVADEVRQRFVADFGIDLCLQQASDAIPGQIGRRGSGQVLLDDRAQ